MNTVPPYTEWDDINILAHNQAPRYIGQQEIPPVAIVTSSAQKLKRFRLDQVLRYTGTYSDTVAQTTLWAFDGKPVCSLVTGVGGASFDRIFVAALLRGARVFIRIGTAGLLAPRAEIGEIVIPTEATGDSAVFRYYSKKLRERDEITGDGWVRPSQALWECLRPRIADPPPGPRITVGRIFSTSLMMHEGPEVAQEYLRLGCVAADMETAVLLAGARSYGMHAIALHVGADHIIEGGLHSETPEQFQMGVAQLHHLLKHLLPVAFDVAGQSREAPAVR